MQTDQNIVYSEQQTLNVKKWIIRPIIISFGMLILVIAIPVLFFYFTGGSEVMKEFFTVPFIAVTFMGGLIPCIILYLMRTRMLLELFITKTGFFYKYKLFSVKERSFLWSDVEAIEIKKYPYTATKPGEQNKIYTKGQDVFVMTVDMIGIEIKTKDGKYKFFTSNDSDALVRAIKSCELNIQITR